MGPLLHFLHSIHPLPREVIDHLQGVVKKKIVHKKHFVCRPGEVCTRIYFVEKGLFRSYCTCAERDISSGFMQEGDLCISVESFFTQQESTESIQALESSVVYFITYEELQELYRLFPSFNVTGRLLTEKCYQWANRQLFTMRVYKAEDRYQWLVENSPELLLRVPLKYLASYLGITDVMLSKIRGRR
ncbi:MAG TPA: Crp/Fnr family transcriptional regulator [Puia sp.]|jgi:CRP-like cAMP-binding protein